MASPVQIQEDAIDCSVSRLIDLGGPGASVGIRLAGSVIYRKAFGCAFQGSPVPLTPAIRMRIDSVSKHFSCLGYLLLCEKGRCSPDDLATDHLPELRPNLDGVTVRHLMTNTSGLHDVAAIQSQFGGHLGGEVMSVDDIVDAYRRIACVIDRPGENWIYNNSGFILLGKIIERISGLTLARYFAEQVFDPIGMANSVVHSGDETDLANCALGHHRQADGTFGRPHLGFDAGGAGSIFSTVDDMLLWLAHMDSPQLGAPLTWRELLTPAVLNNGSGTAYAMGLKTRRRGGTPVLYHSGGRAGSNAFMLRAPDVGLDLVVLANRDDVSAEALGWEIFDDCVGVAEPALPAAHVPKEWLGVYHDRSTAKVVAVGATPNRQVVEIDGIEIGFATRPDGDLVPAPPADNLCLTLRWLPRAGKSHLVLSEFGNVHDLVPVDAADGPELASGVYQAPDFQISAQVDIAAAAGQLRTTTHRGSQDFALERLAPGLWRARNPQFGNMVIVQDRSRDAFVMSNYFVRRLPFVRVG